MNNLRQAAQQALEAMRRAECAAVRNGWAEWDKAVSALRAALAKEEEAAAWLAERKEYWRKEREKAQATKNHDPELSAALGWPGGISDPVLDRTQLLQMVSDMRVAQQPAPEPVAWNGDCILGHCNSPAGCENSEACRAGSAPPQRKPLTEEEIDTLWRAPMSADWEHREFARAIERAHGIIESAIKEDRA